ncbi:MAG: hypothetical protein Q4Q04_05820, partial [Methanocorpusculum sp.]|nr:hypothetical protein [Methanocorpusculum sp.]
SGTYAPDDLGKYAWVAEDQIHWYQQTSSALAEQNGGRPLPAFAFQHIIVPEIYHTLTEVPPGTAGALAGKFSRTGTYYLPNPDYILSGSVNEAPAPPDYNSGEFTAWKNQGDIIAAFFGHDHTNDYTAAWQGIDLIATPGIGFFMYGNGEYHGTRTVTLHENDLLNYSTTLLYYKDIVAEPLPPGIIPTYGAFVQQIVRTVLASLAALAICIGLLAWVIHREKQRKKEN